jgi:hypothetical protein
MLLLVSNKLSYYKKFNLDIWGIFKGCLLLSLSRSELREVRPRMKKYWQWQYNYPEVSKRLDWISRFFFRKNQYKRRRRTNYYFYRLDIIKLGKFFKRRRRKFPVGFRLMRLFYLTLSYKNIKKFFRLAKSKDGLFSSNYLYFLEIRVLPLVYRCSLLVNIFEIIRFIKKGNVVIGAKNVIFPNKRLSFFSLVSFRGLFKGYVYWVLYKRLQRNALISNIPRFIYFSYQFLFFFLIKYPKREDFVNPFPLDVFKISVFALKKF